MPPVGVVHRECFEDILRNFETLALTHGGRLKEFDIAPPVVAP